MDADFTALLAFVSRVLGEDDVALDDADTYCRPLFEHPELVRNVDAAFAAPMQRRLQEAGITAAVLADGCQGRRAHGTNDECRL